MSKVFIEESTLAAIGDEIRNKTGKTDLINPKDMPKEIFGIVTGDVGVYDFIPEKAFNISGDCSYRFAHGGWDWFVEKYGNKISTKDITNATFMFYGFTLEDMPFEINFKDGGGDVGNMFYGALSIEKLPSIDFKQTNYKSCKDIFHNCYGLKEIGTLSNLYPSDISSIFHSCKMLRYLPEFENLNMDRYYTYGYSSLSNMFNDCNSLRAIPEELLNKLYTPLTTASYYTLFNNGFSFCYSLDEIRGLNPQTGTMTSNLFVSTFKNCYRLKDVIFATQEDGSPYVVEWKSQTIDLTTVGYAKVDEHSKILNCNNGITEDKKVYHNPELEPEEAPITKLKDDPDWYTLDERFSRYNRYSASNTIFSLPITNGGNIIKFNGEAGSFSGGLAPESSKYNHTYVSGYAIRNLSEAEIALAAAKGWTVSFV